MDADKLVICTEEDFVEHRNALDVVNFERLDELVDDDHLVIPTGKSFWESLNLVRASVCYIANGLTGNAGSGQEEKMVVCSGFICTPLSPIRGENER